MRPADRPVTAEHLVIDDLSVELTRKGKTLQLLRSVSLDVAQGRVFGLIGESGSGKTMTCRAVVGGLPAGAVVSTGEISIGRSIVRRARGRVDREAALRAAMVFADPHASLDPLQRVGDQVGEMLHVHQGLRGRAAKREVIRLLAEVRLPDPEHVYRQYPFQLSGGMAQRAMIATVLGAKPDFLLADEPTSALDSTIQQDILDLLLRLVREEGVGILLTTHDMSVVANTCDEIAVMYAGKIIEAGPSADVLGDPQHPYTRMLMRARPRGTRTHRLAAIPGEPPVPGEPLPACAVQPRCPWAEDVCVDVEPPLVAHGASVALCHFAGRLTELPE
jgi:oligopeptide/dipeptide ABC transporter ATP-binding protein